jgi:hypothetical protein
MGDPVGDELVEVERSADTDGAGVTVRIDQPGDDVPPTCTVSAFCSGSKLIQSPLTHRSRTVSSGSTVPRRCQAIMTPESPTVLNPARPDAAPTDPAIRTSVHRGKAFRKIDLRGESAPLLAGGGALRGRCDG